MKTPQIKTSKVLDNLLTPIARASDDRSDIIIEKIRKEAFFETDNNGMFSDDELIEAGLMMAGKSLETSKPIYQVALYDTFSFYFVEQLEDIKSFLQGCLKEFNAMKEEGEEGERDLQIKQLERELASLKKKQKVQ